ncbi:HEAT repeat domain-containing protein [Streptacidiphilus griseoplanus]|uniref:HEAT repeat domain-containing protein n=1 Tax=Peterkaempfera griseoplana TaxID=66896 RepID=UPI0006E156D7|nr:HEAT repeat domain-containing protein [Peterkaempfera griseoplana]
MDTAEDPLVAAVRSGDSERVAALLEDGADPDTVDRQGVPVLCTAVAAFDEPVTEALVEGGADPLRRLPDGSTPLLRAVDAGDLLAGRLLRNPGHLADTVREEVLARARHWHETGVVAELRRRTGASGPAGRTRVRAEDEYCDYEEFTLGGMTVRDGHGAILTAFEERFGLRVPFGVLLDRALVRPDREHVTWSEITWTLSQRKNEETWEAASALRSHADPVRRLFGSEVLRDIAAVYTYPEENPFEERSLEIFLPWAVAEPDPEVLTEVLTALNDHVGPQVEAVGLSYRAHPDPRVRATVPRALGTADGFGPEAMEVLLALARDADADVRRAACRVMADPRVHGPAIADALAGLLDDENLETRVTAVHGLALRDDPRCVEGRNRLGVVDGPHAWLLDDVWRYERRRRERSEAPAETPAEPRPST